MTENITTNTKKEQTEKRNNTQTNAVHDNNSSSGSQISIQDKATISTISNELNEKGKVVQIKDIEDALLGFIVMEPDPRMADVMEILPTPDYWNETVNRTIYSAFIDFENSTDAFPRDPALLINALYDWGTFHNKNSSIFKSKENIAKLINGFIKDFTIFDPSEYKRYAEIIRWQKDRRIIHDLAQSVLSQSMSVPYNEREEYLSSVESKLGQITLSIRENKGLLHISEATHTSWDNIERLFHHEIVKPGIQTGINVLDKVIGGFNPGELITLAAQTGAGKTALSLAIAENVAQYEHRAVMIFSLEMMDQQLSDRMLSRLARVSLDQFKKDYMLLNNGEYERLYGVEARDILKGKLEEQYHRLEAALKVLHELPIYQTTASDLNVNSIKSMILQKQRELKQENREELGLVVIDYLQIIQPVERASNRTRSDEVGQMSGKIKQIAKEAGVPILLLAQLNRESEVNEAPTINNLRESASIGHDSDKIIFMYSPNAKNTVEEFAAEYGEAALNKQMKERMKVKLYVAKNRQGQNNIEVDAIFDWSVQSCFSQSDEKQEKETFDEFFDKYYWHTRSGDDVFWPIKVNELPPEFEKYRYSSYVQLPYVDEATKTLIKTNNKPKKDHNILASHKTDANVEEQRMQIMDRIEKETIIDDLSVDFDDFDEETEPYEENYDEDDFMEEYEEDEEDFDIGFDLDDDEDLDIDELPETDYEDSINELNSIRDLLN